jgi:hypothetical protein
MTPERFAQLAPAIQQKILNARAAAERREQKKEDRETLKDWLRLQELQAIPVKQRSKDEHNEFQRLYRKQKRLSEKGEQTISERVEERVKTKEQFWELNKISLQNKIGAWRERQEVVLATLDWLDRLDEGRETPELCGENFRSLEEGLADILADIEEHGVAHLGRLYSNSDIPQDWPDGIFTCRAFFRDPEVFRWLCAENEPTRVYVTAGLITALPDFRVVEFLINHCRWSVRDANYAVGRKTDLKGKVSY